MVRVVLGTGRVMKYSVCVESFPVFSLGEQANVYVSHPYIHQRLHSFRSFSLADLFIHQPLSPSCFLFCLAIFLLLWVKSLQRRGNRFSGVLYFVHVGVDLRMVSDKYEGNYIRKL
jgi:hypothetical protein